MSSDKILVSSYDDFKVLAHKPLGKESSYHLSLNNKKYIINSCYNPAFILKHPILNFFYICYESIYEGAIGTFQIKRNETQKSNLNYIESIESGESNDKEINYKGTMVKTHDVLEEIKKVDSCGKSSCYLLFDKDCKNVININYWNSTISIHPLNNGVLEEACFVYKSIQIHLANDIHDHLHNRQSEPHFHSCVFCGNILLVADLGKDKIHYFEYKDSKISYFGYKQLEKNSGPRYLQIKDKILYVINELNSTIMVFDILKENNNINLNHKQTISTIPNNYNRYNTCGNVLLSPDKEYLFASNRGHNSIVSYKIINSGILKLIDIYDSNGKTPRHFNFNLDGSEIYVANQDSDNVSIFTIKNGRLKLKKKLHYSSPNFVLVFN